MFIVAFKSNQEQIQPVSLGEWDILVVFGSEVSSRINCCKSDEVYFTTLQWQTMYDKMALYL